MAQTRICFIGGGSYNWMPKLLGDLALTDTLSGSVVLHDVNPAALDDIQRYGRKVLQTTGSQFSIETTTDLDRALDGAAFVVVTITTGGLPTMALDLEIPERYGIYQSVGDTVGPGGLARALRNIPVVVGLARAIEHHAAGAWLLTLTNPMSTLCRAVTRTTSVPTIGLCHELIGALQGFVAPLLGVEDLSRL